MDLQKTGKFISDLRKKHGWTQKDLAERVGVTDKAVSRWETGRGFPDVSYLTVLAEILGVPISELIRGERIKLEGKKPAEIMEEVNQTVVNTLEFSRKSTSRDWATAAVICLIGVAIFLCAFGIVYQEVILFWSDIPARYVAYAALLFIIIPTGVPTLIHRINSKWLGRSPLGTYLSGLIVSFMLVMIGTIFFYPEFYIGLTYFGLLRYDFNDTVVYEVLFQLLPINWVLTASINTIYISFKALRLKR